MKSIISPIEYYAASGLITDPREWGPVLDGLPRELPALVNIVQGLMVHIFWAERYGLKLPEDRRAEVNLRLVSKQLRRIHELDDRPLECPRPLGKKLVGNCRDFSTLMVAILRCQGVPARARAGFGAYFMPDHYEDHWVFEYWHASQTRWVMVDAQLDELQQEVLSISFDPLDMPEGQFVTGGKAWQMCRQGQTNPDAFGIFNMHGMEFIRGDLLRDFLALNKMEILPWDGWKPLFYGQHGQLSQARMALFDRIAALTLGGDQSYAEVRAVYERNSRFHPPAELTS
jgi:hypothetical protein